MDYKKYFLTTLIVALSISAVIGIYIFLFGEFGDIETKLLITTLAIGGYSLTGLCCSTIYNRKELFILSIVGMLISVIGLILAIISIWEIVDPLDIVHETMISIILAVSFGHISLLFLVKPKKDYIKHTLYSTILFIIIVAVMLIITIMIEFKIEEFFWRLLGVFAILDVLGTITTPLLNKIKEKED